jgi:hypothetical protein
MNASALPFAVRRRKIRLEGSLVDAQYLSLPIQPGIWFD